MTPSGDAEQAWRDVAAGVLAHVREALGFEMAVLSRRSGDSYVVLGADDSRYGVSPGAVLPWADTFCARMADGSAPRIAPDISEVPAYVEAAELLGMDVAAYVSLPLRDESGALLGTLCAASPRTHSPDLLRHEALLEVLAGTVGALLASQLRLQREARRAERAEEVADVDPLTGLGNRRLWDRALATEERRCASFGLSAAVVAVDADGLKAVNDVLGHEAGDQLLRSIAGALLSALGPDDVVARTGGDEFALLLAEADADRLAAVVQALRAALIERKVSAGIGAALRGPGGLAAAWSAADAALLRDKRTSRPTVRTCLSPVAVAPPADSPGDVLLRELLDLARRQLGADIAFIGDWRGGPSGVRVMRDVTAVQPVGVGRGHTESLETTYCQRIVDGRLPRVIPDTAEEPEALALPVTTALPIGSYVGVPVVLSDGHLYGTLCVLSGEPDSTLSERDADFLAALAESMSRVLEAEVRTRAAHSAAVARLDPVLRGRGLHTVYQPVLSVVDGSLAGLEALSRFGPDAAPPVPWFTDAASVGLTGELELAAARAALQRAPGVPGFLALNFSATTICSPAFATLLEGHDPTVLVVEVSEHEEIRDYAPLLAALRPWRDRGLRVAVDDAGAGFASLRHVVLLAPDLIKLDLSLVRAVDTDPARQSLTVALTTFARATGAQVVAEGVQTVEERNVLAAAGVELMQGWLFGAGMPAADLQRQYGGVVPRSARRRDADARELLAQRTPSRSTTNTSVSPPLMAPPAPREP